MARKLKSPKKKPPKTKALSSKSRAADPAESPQHTGFIHFLSKTSASPIQVTEQTALTCASVWACVRVITEGLAKLPLRAFKKLTDGQEGVPDNPVDWLLQTQANPETNAFQFRETIIAHALTWGNGYAEIERDLLGRPVWLWQIAPDRVRPDRDSRGQIVYEVRNSGEANTILPAEDVFHLKGLGFNGLVGYSVIQMAVKTISAALAADGAAATLWENDTTPGGILKTPKGLSSTARENLRKSWKDRHGTAANRRTIAILEEGLEWVQTQLPAHDQELLESRKFTPLEICRFFRVQPHKIAELTRATFSNIEEQSREHVEDTLMPWAIRFEQEANIKLFPPRMRRNFYVKHNFAALLRGNAQARAAFFLMMLDRGVYSINEVREFEELNPIGPDGDKRFVMQNMQTLENAGKLPPPAPSPPMKHDNAPPPEEKDVASMTAARSLLIDGFGRVLRREQHRLEDAVKRRAGKPQEAEKWVSSVFAEHSQYLRATMKVPTAAAARLIGAELAELPEQKYQGDMNRRALSLFADGNGFDVDFIAEEYADFLIAIMKGDKNV